MGTAVAAVKSGIVIFTIPFVFAFYPEILLIEEARLASADIAGISKTSFLPGYSSTIDLQNLALLLFRLAIALYLVSSCLARHDMSTIGFFEVSLRLGIAVFLLFKAPVVFCSAIVAAIILLALHRFRHSSKLMQ
jgi:TRAP-type uncharacterized transport system fused permease subunit